MADIAKLIYKKNTLYGWGKEDIVKVFTLPNDVTTAEALAIAQEAYDWYNVWNVPVLKKWSAFFYVARTESSADYDYELAFYQWRLRVWDNPYAWVTDLVNTRISLSISNWTAVEITTGTPALKSVLATWVDYATPYTPEYDWSPATKKYVDDMVWDIETLLSNI